MMADRSRFESVDKEENLVKQGTGAELAASIRNKK